MRGEGRKKEKRPKFKVGQVVSVCSFYGDFAPGEVGPGFEGMRGWRHGFMFGKIVKILPPEGKIPPCYFLDGWISAQVEHDLRALTKREIRRA